MRCHPFGGDDGQGNAGIVAPTTRAITKDAAQFINDTVMAPPGEVTLAPVGRLTNIALAMQREPRRTENVREIVLMRVDTGHSCSRGKTVASSGHTGWEEPWTGRTPVRILTDADVRRLVELELGRLAQ